MRTGEVCTAPFRSCLVTRRCANHYLEPRSTKCRRAYPPRHFPRSVRATSLASQLETMLSSLSRLLFVVDDGTNPSRSAGSSPSSAGGGAAGATVRPRSNRIMEPAPPTYEEALTFFVKDGNGSGTRGPLAITESPANGSSANGRSRPSLSDDYEMAERLQQEEIERCSVLQSGRERSTSLSAAAGPFSGGGRPSRNEGARWSVSSAPGDIRPVPRMSRALERSLISPRSGQLRTIHEGKQKSILPNCFLLTLYNY